MEKLFVERVGNGNANHLALSGRQQTWHQTAFNKGIERVITEIKEKLYYVLYPKTSEEMVISLVHHSLVVTMVIINVQQQFGATFIYDADPPTGGEKKER